MPDTTTVEINEIFTLAEAFVLNTSRSVFLTGKAGTGKTTFLKHIQKVSNKNTVVVAPTGVAAIHAGGVTIHSFFQLPFAPFIPVPSTRNTNQLSDRYNLLQNLRIESEKRKLFRELELLIIDEVSMVRCDVLDAIDTVLRYFRKKEDLPFGGVQVLFIGDLFQLPPVMPDADWQLLSPYYSCAFFFDAYVVRSSPPLYLELKKVYRQRDAAFIGVLNRIRNNEITAEDLTFLHQRYKPGFRPGPEEYYVTLTTHNHKADAINANEMEKLTGRLSSFAATISGDFPERAFPTDRELQLKIGAQVMFIKNDTERIRRYFNGKIGTIAKIEESKILVSFNNGDEALEVEKDVWRNIKYALNEETRQVDEEELGTFMQYPLRLAWAITIHKSQGLTFDHVIIDAGSSFAPGQVYVALSRCTSIEGIVLYSKIFPSAIRTDERVIRFAKEELDIEELKPALVHARHDHVLNTLMDVFDLRILIEEIIQFKSEIDKRKTVDKTEAHALIDGLTDKLTNHQTVVMRFRHQLRTISKQHDYTLLKSRIDAAVDYFSNALANDVIMPLTAYAAAVKLKKKTRKYHKQVVELKAFVESYKSTFARATKLSDALVE
ncbi:MAG TPA: DEAD/DEAH box helicase [Ohtaekwangia sp.]|nr:DEAD/DEAH box helicase [Ohtaekwangia sp.]